MCPLCLTAVSIAERDLLSHLLARHPAELTVLTAVLTLAQVGLVKKPQQLLALDLLVLCAGVILARWDPRHRGM